ncbi:MAG: hypothetical protein A2026_17705 [Deltaproteobacteria bacterium RBG_19FT_COMBO_46_12]|nr:MAG: hypothetical protein A2026_17705 [Deltaproteobacteria bacterium RBG_19FT_COMBO_46_12]
MFFRACFGLGVLKQARFFPPYPLSTGFSLSLDGRGWGVIYRICHSCGSRNPYHFLNLYLDSHFHGNDRSKIKAKNYQGGLFGTQSKDSTN